MDPSRKISSNMKSLSTKMLQILWKIRGFELQNVANTIEMAASSSKMLQIAEKTDRTVDQEKNKAEKHNSQNISGPYIYIYIYAYICICMGFCVALSKFSWLIPIFAG